MRQLTGLLVMTGLGGAAALGFDQVFTTTHADIGIGYKSGAWDLHVHDEDNDIEYEPSEVLFFAGENTKAARPAGAQWDFLGVGAGADYWTLPQFQVPDKNYIGVGTEEIAAGTFASYFESDPRVSAEGAWIRLSLVGVNGPGDFSAWTSDAFGEPQEWMSSFGGITAADSLFVGEESEAHFNWSFTATGLYEISFQASAFITNDLGGLELVASAPVVYNFGVEAIPEPGAALLLSVGMLAGLRRR